MGFASGAQDFRRRGRSIYLPAPLKCLTTVSFYFVSVRTAIRIWLFVVV